MLGSVMVAGTGQVGLGQRFATNTEEYFRHLAAVRPQADAIVRTGPQSCSPARFVAAQTHVNGHAGDSVKIGTALAHLMLADMQSTNADRGAFGALAAYEAAGKPSLVEFSINSFQPEQRTAECWYSSMGSGGLLADGYLALARRTFWKDGQPNVEEAVFAAVWVIYHAIAAAPGFIAEPIDVAVLKKWDGKKYSAQMLPSDQLEEHRNAAIAADAHLAKFRDKAEAPPPPPVPPPDSR